MKRETFAELLKSALNERLRDRWHLTRYVQQGMEKWEWDLPGVHVREVTAQLREDDVDVRVIFTEDAHPGCTFGYVWRDVWSFAAREERQVKGPSPEDDELVTDETVTGHATLMYITFHEQVSAGDLGLPDCAPGVITWIEYRRKQP